MTENPPRERLQKALEWFRMQLERTETLNADEIMLKQSIIADFNHVEEVFSAFMREQTVREQKLRKLWEERPRGKTIHEQNPNISDSDLIRVFFIEYIKWELEFLEVEFEKVFDDSTPAEETKQ